MRSIAVKTRHLRVDNLGAPSHPGETKQLNQLNLINRMSCFYSLPMAPAGVESVLFRIACQLELQKPVGGCSFERKLSEICTM